MCSPVNSSGVLACRAARFSAARAAGICSTDTAGTPDLNTPAFSEAIFSTVLPNWWVWSRLMLVSPTTMGLTTFVLSSRPPRPVSRIAMSTSMSTKCWNAKAVNISKKVGLDLLIFSICTEVLLIRRVSAARVIISPLIRIRSRMSIRCGEVYRPTLCPQALSIWASMVAVEPLPLVPAI